MSTDINIKNKVAILEEGVNITTDALSIDFVGSGVNSSTVGNNVTVTIPGGLGTTTYYLNESVTQTPYKEFSSVATAAAEQVVPLTVSAGATSVIAEFQTPTGVPNTTQIPGGLWQFFLHFNAGAAGQNWIIRPTVYKRDLGGIETLLFTPDPEIVTAMSTTTTMYVSDGVFPATTLVTTDRIVVRISVQNTTGVSQTVSFRTEGSQHYSVGLTTLNQVISGGSVASVTGTAPIVSSGGPTPAISIPLATGSANGYLSSSDWSVFSAKLGGSGTTNYLPKFTPNGTTLGNSLLQDNGTSMSVNTAPSSTYGFYFNYASGQASIFGQNTFTGAGDSAGVVGSGGGTVTGTNLGGSFLAFNNATLNIGVKGSANSPTAGANIGGYFLVANGTNNYAVQLQDGTEGIGKVLTCITSDGKANWATPSSVNIYNTNGTLTGSRSVTLGVNDLTFGGFGASGTTQFNRGDGTQSAQITLQKTTITQITTNTSGTQSSRNQTINSVNQVVDTPSGYSEEYQDATTWYAQIFNSSAVSLFKLGISSSGLNINNAYTLPKIDGTANQVLTTNGAGVVTWNTASSGISGSGTLNYVAKWTPSGTALGDSNIFDNGTNVGIGTATPAKLLDVNGDMLVNGLTVGRGTSGSTNNAILGISAGAGTGTLNAYMGTNAGRYNGGSGCVGVGLNAGGYYGSSTLPLSSSSNCVFIGNQSSASANGVSNEIVIGSQTIGKGSDTAVIGNDSLTHTYLKGVLHVSNNAYTLPNVAPTVGQVLGYGSAGVSTWVSAVDPYTIRASEVFRGVSFNNNTTTTVLSGGVTISTAATTTAKNISGSSFVNKVIGIAYNASVVSTGRYTGIRGAALLWFIGGGFRYTCSFNVSDTVYGSGCRQFYGMQGSIVDLTYSDSALVTGLLNCIGVGSDALDTNLQIFSNDASGAATKIDLGVGFPANRTAGAAMTTIYEVQLYNAPGTTTVLYRVENKETAAVVTGTISTDLPLGTQGLNFFASRCMGTPTTGTGQFILTGQCGVYSTN